MAMRKPSGRDILDQRKVVGSPLASRAGLFFRTSTPGGELLAKQSQRVTISCLYSPRVARPAAWRKMCSKARCLCDDSLLFLFLHARIADLFFDLVFDLLAYLVVFRQEDAGVLAALAQARSL